MLEARHYELWWDRRVGGIFTRQVTGCRCFAQNVSDGVTNPVAPTSETPARFVGGIGVPKNRHR
ncbi:MAG: hypothetical protein NTX45_11565 [Proteobacteria bacterium]|nr:hypothetical protein [Pseudomonadota bacterium]